MTADPMPELPEPIPFEELPAARQEQIRTRLGEIAAEYQARGYLPPDEADRLHARVAVLEVELYAARNDAVAFKRWTGLNLRAADHHRARAETAEAAVEQVRALHIKRTGLCPECMVIWPCPTIRALDAAGTPAEVPTTGPKAPTSARQDVGTPALVHQIKSIADRVLTLRPVPATRPSAYEEGWQDAVDAVLDALDDARDLLLDAAGTPAPPPADDDPAVLAVLAAWDRKGDFQNDPDSAPVMLQYARDAVTAVRAAGTPAPTSDLPAALDQILDELDAEAASYRHGSGPVEYGHASGLGVAVYRIRAAMAAAGTPATPEPPQ